MCTVYFLTHNTPILKIYGGKYSCLLVYVPSIVIHLHSQTRFLQVFLISFLQPSSFKNQENQIFTKFLVVIAKHHIIRDTIVKEICFSSITVIFNFETNFLYHWLLVFSLIELK